VLSWKTIVKNEVQSKQEELWLERMRNDSDFAIFFAISNFRTTSIVYLKNKQILGFQKPWEAT